LNNMNIGDTLVFIGENIEDDHFKNFTYGKQYVIKDFSSDLPDTDELGIHTAVFFHNHMWGCLLCNLPKYFVILEDFRNMNIKKIIND
jgi:hypothetical protein